MFRKSFFPNVIENIFFEILLPKTTPITVGIMYRPPGQTNFLENLNIIFEKIYKDQKQIYILDDFNMNMYPNNGHIARDDNTISSKFLCYDLKNYHQLCTLPGLKQLIQSPTPVTCIISTLTDHKFNKFLSEVNSSYWQNHSLQKKRVKGNTQKWFDSEVLEKLNLRKKLFKKFKKS